MRIIKFGNLAYQEVLQIEGRCRLMYLSLAKQGKGGRWAGMELAGQEGLELGGRAGRGEKIPLTHYLAALELALVACHPSGMLVAARYHASGWHIRNKEDQPD